MKEQATPASKSTLTLAVNPETPKHLSKLQWTKQLSLSYPIIICSTIRKLQIDKNYPSGDKRTDETPTRKDTPPPAPNGWSLEGFLHAAGKEEMHLAVEMLKSFPTTTYPVFSQDITPKTFTPNYLLL